MAASVYQVNSGVDIPRKPMPQLFFSTDGPVLSLPYDQHAYLEKAVYLLPYEMYVSLAGKGVRVADPKKHKGFIRREGDLVRPADLGEHITTVGLEYGMLHNGAVLRVGNAAMEITGKTTPPGAAYEVFGSRLERSLYGGKQEWWGLFAKVIEEGIIRPADQILTLEYLNV